MKKLLSFIVAINALYAYSQEPVSFPAAWYRADYVVAGDTLWHDQSGYQRHAQAYQGVFPGKTLFNYNPAFLFDSVTSAFTLPLSGFDFSSSASKTEVMVMIAYQAGESGSERGLWAFATDSSLIGLSTRHIFGERAVIRYQDTTRTDAIVNTITQSWKQNDFAPGRLLVGGMDTLPFKGKLGEVIVFDHRTGSKDLLKWQSYLAVKHGITLYKKEYVTSQDDTSWHYNDHPLYNASISGLGRDTVFGLHQKQSVMDNRLTIGIGGIATSNPLNSSVIPEGNFLVWGVDSNLFRFPQNTYLQNGEELLTFGNCLMEVTGNAVRTLPTSVQMDISGWQDVEPLNCVLLIDRDHTSDFSGSSVELYTPTHTDTNGIITFSNIYWDTDYSGSDLFRIGFYSNDTTEFSTKSLVTANTGNHNPDMDNHPSVLDNIYSLYPNPTSGNYNLSISLSCVSDVVIRVISPEGKILETRYGKGESNYQFTGGLSVKGHYLIEVESSLERKVLQLIQN